MDNDQGKALGAVLRDARQARQLSTRDLAELAAVDQATIVRLEAGSFRSPRSETLVKVSEALGLDTGNILTLAGTTPPAALPTMRPYLRAKYQNLSSDDIEAIEKYATRLARKRGVSLDGPVPGEDES